MMDAVERDPATPLTVDLVDDARDVRRSAVSRCRFRPATRDAFLNGSWDATGQLLENLDRSASVAARLPYVSGGLVRRSVFERPALIARRPGTPPPRDCARLSFGSQSHLSRPAERRNLHRDEVAARDLGQRAAARQQRDADPHFDRAFDAVEARQRDLDVDRRAPALVRAEHALARGRRIVVRDDDLAPDLLERDSSSGRQRMPRRREQDEIVGAERHRLDAAVGRLKRQHAEVEASDPAALLPSGVTGRGGRRRPTPGCSAANRST